jgi:hypothetical protein
MTTREYFSAPAVIRTGFYTPMFGLDALTKHMLCFGDGLDEIKTAFLLFLSLVHGFRAIAMDSAHESIAQAILPTSRKLLPGFTGRICVYFSTFPYIV